MSYADDVSSLGCNLMLELVAFTRFFERLPFLLETRGFPTLQRACPAQLLVREKKLQACPLPPIPFRFYTQTKMPTKTCRAWLPLARKPLMSATTRKLL